MHLSSLKREIKMGNSHRIWVGHAEEREQNQISIRENNSPKSKSTDQNLKGHSC